MEEEVAKLLGIVTSRCPCHCLAEYERQRRNRPLEVDGRVQQHDKSPDTEPRHVQTLFLVPYAEEADADWQTANGDGAASHSSCHAYDVSAYQVVTADASCNGTQPCTASYAEIEAAGLSHAVHESLEEQLTTLDSLRKNGDPLCLHLRQDLGGRAVCRVVPGVASAAQTGRPDLLILEVFSTSPESDIQSCSPLPTIPGALLQVTSTAIGNLERQQRLHDEANRWKILLSVQDTEEDASGKLSKLCQSCLRLAQANGVVLTWCCAGASDNAKVLYQATLDTGSSRHLAETDATCDDESAGVCKVTVLGPAVAQGQFQLRLVKNPGEAFSTRTLSSVGWILKKSQKILEAGLIARTAAATTSTSLVPRQSSFEVLLEMQDIVQEVRNEGEELSSTLHKLVSRAVHRTRSESAHLFVVKDNAASTAKLLEASVSISSVEVDTADKVSVNKKPLQLPVGQGIAAASLRLDTTLNITQASRSPHFSPDVDNSYCVSDAEQRRVLCMPVRRHNDVLGVLQLCRSSSSNAPYSTVDEDVARICSLHCSSAISQQSLYKDLMVAENRSNLLTELMLFHMQVPDSELLPYIQQPAWSLSDLDAKLHISSFTFTGMDMEESETVQAMLGMFEEMQLCQRWKIPKEKLCRFVLTVQRGYRDPPYHNWRHAVSVAHFCFYLWKKTDHLKPLTDLEVLALFVACLCHDIDHRGTTNNFQQTAGSALASLYFSQGSVMERHHFAQTMCILSDKRCNIFSELSEKDCQAVTDLIYEIILDTDISRHLAVRKKPILQLAEGGATAVESENASHRSLLLALAVSASDLNSGTKNWLDAQYYAERLYAEFFNQGEMERALASQPGKMMNRDLACIPEEQIGFISFIAQPVFESLAALFPETQEVLDRVMENYDNWQRVKEDFWQKSPVKEGFSTVQAPTPPTQASVTGTSPLATVTAAAQAPTTVQAPVVQASINHTLSSSSSGASTHNTVVVPPPADDEPGRKKSSFGRRARKTGSATSVGPAATGASVAGVAGNVSPAQPPATRRQRPSSRHSVAHLAHRRKDSILQAASAAKRHASHQRSVSVAHHPGGEVQATSYISGPSGLLVLPSYTSRKYSASVGVTDIERMLDWQAPVSVSRRFSSTPLRSKPSNAPELALHRLGDDTTLRRSLAERMEKITPETTQSPVLTGHETMDEDAAGQALKQGITEKDGPRPGKPGKMSFSRTSVGSTSSSEVTARSSQSSRGDADLQSEEDSQDTEHNSSSSDAVNMSGSNGQGTTRSNQRRRKQGSHNAHFYSKQRLEVAASPCKQILSKWFGNASRSDPGPSPDLRAQVSGESLRRPSEPARF
ncbi:uncharacterized protein LOC135811308 isoform X2 [Sycon ciliatum]|uniref:uncharacterized protein LOC135811308 isoform X2 n=1 Tax=Sycon ciliatum TaxID=27933 RepID=UPI0031F6BFEA